MKHSEKNLNKRLRVFIFRSNCHIYGSIIDDGKILATASSKEISEKIKPIQIAEKVGELLAKKLKEKKIDQIFFDRNGYRYHGRVKALADGMRKGGISF